MEKIFNYGQAVTIKKDSFIYPDYTLDESSKVKPISKAVYYFARYYSKYKGKDIVLISPGPMDKGTKLVHTYAESLIPIEDPMEAKEEKKSDDIPHDYYLSEELKGEYRLEKLEAIKPDYYQRTIKGASLDVFDIAKAYNLPNTLFNALKYMLRVKGNKDKRINDLEKLIECVNREINFLNNNK